MGPSAGYLSDSYVFNWHRQTFAGDLIFVIPIALCLGVVCGVPDRVHRISSFVGADAGGRDCAPESGLHGGGRSDSTGGAADGDPLKAPKQPQGGGWLRD